MIRSGGVALLLGIVLLGACETAKRASLPERPGLHPGAVFTDCAECPEMIVVPAGSFEMGSRQRALEGPIHSVAFAKPFAAGRYEVTFEEWDACVADGGCGGYQADDEGWGRGRQPVVNVSWWHAWSYAWWLREKTGRRYRLLNEAEWEYVARAGAQTRYWWGDSAGSANANCVECGSEWDGKRAAPVGMFRPNAFGLYDTAGNVWEWVNDCLPVLDARHGGYFETPTDGTAQLTKGSGQLRILRGGSWHDYSRHMRSANRRYDERGFLDGSVGFRVARDLD